MIGAAVMTEQTLPKTKIENGIEYLLDEEMGTYLPNLALEESEPLGKYGRMRKKYLQEHLNTTYQAMILKGTLDKHLTEIDRTANNRLDMMIKDMAKTQGVTEKMKAEDQMMWVGMMNNIKASAEEIILNELIFN